MAEKVTNSLVPKKKTFSQALETESYKAMIATSIQDDKKRMKFIADITSYVANNKLLQECDNVSVLSAALQGNALNLSPILGEYWVVPYKTKDGYKANFQLGVAGRIQLALRSGQYRKLNAIEIREGEYKGKDRFTGEPIFSFVEDDDAREKLPIIGYMAYFELLNGYFQSVYFSKEKVLAWAQRYSKAFDRKLYEKFIDGKITDYKEQQQCSSPWYERFDTMACNTVLKQVLKFGPKSVEMRIAEEEENKYGDKIVGDFGVQFSDGEIPPKNDEEEVSDDFFAEEGKEQK